MHIPWRAVGPWLADCGGWVVMIIPLSGRPARAWPGGARSGMCVNWRPAGSPVASE